MKNRRATTIIEYIIVWILCLIISSVLAMMFWTSLVMGGVI